MTQRTGQEGGQGDGAEGSPGTPGKPNREDAIRRDFILALVMFVLCAVIGTAFALYTVIPVASDKPPAVLDPRR